jgi:hypothetical protein
MVVGTNIVWPCVGSRVCVSVCSSRFGMIWSGENLNGCPTMLCTSARHLLFKHPAHLVDVFLLIGILGVDVDSI